MDKQELKIFRILDAIVRRESVRIVNRWVSIPSNIWHKAVVPRENWVVVSSHTVLEGELVEERPDETNTRLTHQRRYLDALKQ
ncbi:hypothetical protein ACFLXZ_00755 [Chloroflexota bacterium]